VAETADRDVPMSLMEHLSELRSRLLRCTLAVVGLGVLSLVFAKPIFGLLMRPVLEALPADARSLVYTSGIEELNVLMKVGLYCGIFLSTPVILWQLWSFVAPGLYPSERKLAAPFIVLGTTAFLTGAAFCYFVLLPTMFQFLLQEPEVAALRVELGQAKVGEEDILRMVRLGEYRKAGELAEGALKRLEAPVDQLPFEFGATRPDPGVSLDARLDALGRLIDAAADGAGPPGRPTLSQVMALRLEAVAARQRGDLDTAAVRMDEAASRLAAISPADAGPLATVWRFGKELASGRTQWEAQNWTRPMLTMSEQLTLVLILELAMGIIFELPLVMALLALVGIVQARWLFRYQRHALVVCIILAAIITPTGDAINLALLAGPMMLCYEIGVLAVWLIERRRKKAADATALSVRP
jgi:sec-independent protein translocase protein TatC